MEYYVTKFTIKVEDEILMQTCRELLADMAAETGYESFIDTPEGINAYVQTSLYNKYMLDDEIANFPIDGIEITYQTEAVANENWNATWEEAGFDPIIVKGDDGGRTCIIYDAKSSLEAASMYNGAAGGAAGDATTDADATITIAIDARMAFGTGTHETTRMIVTQMLKTDIKGKRVLDCGCGTGILSLLAKRCGAEHVTAYDIDEWSVDNTKHNGEINGIPLMDVLLGDVSVLSHVDGVFDIILANINRNILLNDMPSIVETLSPDGKLILSGFYENDAQLLLEKASTLGLYEVSRQTDNNWCMLVLHR